MCTQLPAAGRPHSPAVTAPTRRPVEEAWRGRAARPGQPDPAVPGLERSIRPGVPVPATLLVAEMRDGALFLQGWRDGPGAYVIAEDAGPLRQALAAAFGNDTSGEVKR